MSEILRVVDLKKRFPVYGSLGRVFGPKTYVNAVSDVSFTLNEGETYGLVGESGSGKTTTGRAILGLTTTDSGQVIYKDIDLLKLSKREFRPFRKELQFVFQDPFSSLNPRKRIGSILEEPLIIHGLGSDKERQARVFDILNIVGLLPEHYFRFPHEFSGGQRQRLGLARALIMNPKIIICDEPVSALDVSIQAQILNLLKQLQIDMKLTLLFITHDIGVVRHVSTRIGVMYLGSIVETGNTDSIFANPLHPYTQALFSAVPGRSKNSLKNRIILNGEITSLASETSGCAFYTRCPKADQKCRDMKPDVREYEADHFVACHLL